MVAVNISKDKLSFYFDVQEDSIENFKGLFTEDGMIKYGIGRRSGCKMEEITTTEQMDNVEVERAVRHNGGSGFSRNSRGYGGGSHRGSGGYRGNNNHSGQGYGNNNNN